MLTSARLTGLTGIAHGFFTREGGVSTGLYAGLNCGFGSGDERAAVAENRARVIKALGASDLMTVHQIHSPHVVTVTSLPPPSPPPEADAIVTNVAGLAIGVLTADCAPVLMADAQAGVIAAAHAGWKGALLGVVQNTVAAMAELGAVPDRIRAAVGPALMRDSFEVGPEFVERFIAEDADYARYFHERADWTKPHFDLLDFVADRLREAGIKDIDSMAIDTYPDVGRFFSYRRSCHRREADYGRQIAAIAMP